MNKQARYFLVIFVAALIGAALWYKKLSPAEPSFKDQQLILSQFAPKTKSLTPGKISTHASEPDPVKLDTSAKSGINDDTVKISAEEIEKLRSTAKAKLAQNYASQKSYFAEFNRYTTDLEAAGWQPPEPILNYKVGFLEPYRGQQNNETASVKEDPRRMDSDALIAFNNQKESIKLEYTNAAEAIDLSDYQGYCRSHCTADDHDFEILLALPLGDAQHVDVWSINSKKELVLLKDGTQNFATN